MITSSHLLVLYESTLKKYHKYKKRLEKNVANGQFDYYSQKRKTTIIRRIQRLLRRLGELKTQIKLAAACGALALSLGTANGQQLGPFVQNDSINPFKQPFIFDTNTRPALVDLDNDGDMDLIIGEAYSSSLKYFENVGTPEKAFYIERIETANPFQFLGGSLSPAPTFSDLDGDGDYDLTVGFEYEFEELQYYINNDSDNGVIGDDPSFSSQTPFPGKGTNDIKGSGYHQHPTYVDIDDDGDLDLFIGSNAYTGDFAESMQFFRNDGNSTAPSFVNVIGLPAGLDDFLSRRDFQKVAPTFYDFDGDDDFDLLVGFADGTFRYYRNDGSATNPSFNEQTGTSNPFNGVDIGSDAGPTLADLDNDGDKDVIIGRASPGIKYFKNNDGVFSEQFTSGNPFDGLDVGYFANPEFADIDGDGDQDLVIGGNGSSARNTGYMQYHENIGKGCFEERRGTENPLTGFPTTDHHVPEFDDLDKDGLLDLLLGLENNVLLYLNTGTGSIPAYTNSSTPLTLLPTGTSRFAPSLSTKEPSTDFDMALGHAQNTIEDLFFYENTGTPPSFGEIFPSDAPLQGGGMGRFTVPELVDIDHDGDDDLFVGLEDGTTLFFEKTASGAYQRFSARGNPLGSLGEDEDISPAFTDIDLDGDLDAFLGTRDGFIIYYQNTNEPPTVNPSGDDPISVQENSTVTIDENLELDDDGDDDIIEAQVTIDNFEADHDFLTFTPVTGIAGDFDTSKGLLILTGRASLSEYEDVLQSVEFETTSDDPVLFKTVSIKVFDFDATNPGPSSIARYDIEIQPVNDPPVLEPGLPAQARYVEDEPGVAIAPALSLTDPDNTVLQEATVTISGNYDREQDLLEFTTQNGITGTFDAQNGILTLSGTGISIAAFESALRTVMFRNTSDMPSTALRTITFSVSDLETSTSTAKAVEVIPVNDPPILSSPNTDEPLEYTNISSTVIVDSDISITDVDNENLESAEIAINGAASGDFLEASVPSAITQDFDDQRVVLTLLGSATIEEYQQALRSVTFSTAEATGGVRSITFRVNDGQEDSEVYTRNVNVITEIEVFNALSPNGDDKNQFLEIAGLSTPNKVEIYNRWGDLVYETNDYDNATNRFEGDSDSGNELPTGTYYYKINVRGNEYTGYLVIKR